MTKTDKYQIDITGEEKSMLLEWFVAAEIKYIEIADLETSNEKIAKAIDLRDKIMKAEAIKK